MATEPFQGLRVDIFERVHLADDLAGIRGLNEIELTPTMDIRMQDDHVLLNGNLHLQGTYYANFDNQLRILSHLIPVEITVPFNRLHHQKDLQIEIENFDVDLLSSRSLNVTGILLLKGLNTAPINHPASYMARDEPVEQLDESPDHLPAWQEENEQELTASTNQSLPEEEIQPNEREVVEDTVVPSDLSEMRTHAEGEGQQMPEEFEELDFMSSSQLSSTEPTEASPSLLPVDEIKEDAPSPSSQVVNIVDPAHHPLRDRQDAPNNRMDWQQLCKTNQDDSYHFKKMRMCIVQKNDTLELLSQRHHVESTELQRMNQLLSDELKVGQILYLP